MSPDLLHQHYVRAFKQWSKLRNGPYEKRRHCLLVIAAIEEIRMPAKRVYGSSHDATRYADVRKIVHEMNQGTLFEVPWFPLDEQLPFQF